MIEKILSLNPILQAFLATLFTFSITALGSALVFFLKRINKTFMDGMLGFAAGIMISASFFSLIIPSLEMAKEMNYIPWLLTTIGFILGGLLLFIGDKVYDILEKKNNSIKNKKSLKRIIMLISSITLHNIPEGMAIGVSFGSVIYGINGTSLISAWTLALGIGLQNFPEGSAKRKLSSLAN